MRITVVDHGDRHHRIGERTNTWMSDIDAATERVPFVLGSPRVRLLWTVCALQRPRCFLCRSIGACCISWNFEP